MSHALPAPLHDLDAKRIVATAFAIALHVLALMLLLAPMKFAPRVAIVESPPIEIFYKELEPPPIPPPPHETRPVEHRPVTHAPPAQPVVDEPPVINTTPGPMDIPYEPVVQPPADTFNPPPSGPIALTVLENPAPTYPSVAIRRNITGKVVLRIEVDASGRPVSGVIEQSSGSSLLDNAALKAVLAKWRFVPAQHAGQSIAATALVPIVFSLD
jgi:periplasmic protein TonB